MAKVIIFGVLDTAELAHYYLSHDSEHEVVAFTVHEKYIKDAFFKGLPVVPYEEITKLYPPGEYAMFAPMTAKNMNRLREGIYLDGKQKGYTFISYVSSRVSMFGNKIGENCFILEDNTIQPFTTLGNNIVLWSGNHIGHHGEIKDHVFFTSHVVLSGHCVIEPYCFFGVNATIRDYSHLAQGTLLAMGSCLVQQVTDEWGVYVGNPAKKKEGKLSHEVY